MKQLPILLLSLTSLIIVETTSPDTNTIINGNNLFAVDIFQRLNVNNTQNIVVCPFAAYTGLSLLRSGATEGSADQLRKVLYGSNDLQEDELTFKQLLREMKNKDLRTNISSHIFVDKIYKIRDEYQQRALDIFNANTSYMDLSDKQKAATIFNEWVKKATNSKIETIIKPDDTSTDTRVVALNALYFQAKWHHPFVASDTVDQIFFVPGGPNVIVKTMKRTHFHGLYAENKKLNVKFLELPLSPRCGHNIPCPGGFRENTSLVIVLPNEIDGVYDLQPNIYEALRPQNFIPTLLNLYLPRFEDKNTINLKTILEMLGVNYIFSPATANLGNIAGKNGDIYLDNYLQKVLLNVNEQGVEAAGATDFTIDTTPPIPPLGSSALSDNCCPQEPIDFRVNHPFVYYVKANGLITFVGKVYSPLHILSHVEA